MYCHLESKTPGAFNFIRTFALKLCNSNQTRIIEMTQHMTSQTRRKNVKVKVSHTLIAVGAVGVRVPLYLGRS